ncbi:hypothetical protein Ac2012v2_000667 [Leucoagaricus gongylophorus]
MSALAELALTAFLIGKGNENRTWPTNRYHSLLVMFLFNATWTMVFSAGYILWMLDGGSQILASVASSVIWLIITTILWGIAAGVMHNTRGGGDCDLKPIIHRYGCLDGVLRSTCVLSVKRHDLDVGNP